MMFVAIIIGAIVGMAESRQFLRFRSFALVSVFMLFVCIYSFGISHMSTWDWGLVRFGLFAGVIFYLIPCVLISAAVSLSRWLGQRDQKIKSESL